MTSKYGDGPLIEPLYSTIRHVAIGLIVLGLAFSTMAILVMRNFHIGRINSSR